MTYRVCKSFHVESGHMLSKHPGLCRFPHGHSRRIDVVLASDRLDKSEMVCDFKTLKLAVSAFIERFDHAMAVNSNDPLLPQLKSVDERVVVFDNADPTTELLAKFIYDHLATELASGKTYTDERGHKYTFAPGVKLERVRVTETATSWAEYGL
jgi:6-pyruvoyltetrahydropterin/6-carboxytetrahydropterin synthase